MNQALTTLVNRLDSAQVKKNDVIAWGSPVPAFGDLSEAVVATMGLNPSNREFVGKDGRELKGSARRFETLHSLGITSWADADARHLRLIEESCNSYFKKNPYDQWFKVLDKILRGSQVSYYDSSKVACHLDLIPYATNRKWTDLSTDQRNSLIEFCRDTLGVLLQSSQIRGIILNGASVVNQFQRITGVKLDEYHMSDWSLPRKSGKNISGVAYSGWINAIDNVDLDQRILVLGYNHNLQSSFGVTKHVTKAIADWVQKSLKRVL